MPASPADSLMYRALFGDDETAQLFTDSAEVRAMVLVEGALAKVQGELGLIPETAAAFLHRAGFEVQIDPAGLAVETGRNGVPVPALVEAMRKALEAPEHAAWLHWGATSQDIMDTALALRLKRVLALWQARLDRIITDLGALAQAHADLAMPGRTYGQVATPTTFGAVVAEWGAPLIRHRDRLGDVMAGVAQVSLSGAAGTLSAMGPQGPDVRAALARSLGLSDPGASWHSTRDGIAALGAWMAGLTASLAKMGEDLILLCQSGIDEVALPGAGASSTMPQKQNPVGPSVLVALARQVGGLSGTLTGAVIHRQERDGVAWFTEWLTLPQICILTGAALSRAGDVVGRIAPQPQAMARNMARNHGLIHAEAISFALARRLPRPEAQVRIKALCAEAMETGTDLRRLVARDWPETDWQTEIADTLVGQAPAMARSFAARARGIGTRGG